MTFFVDFLWLKMIVWVDGLINGSNVNLMVFLVAQVNSSFSCFFFSTVINFQMNIFLFGSSRSFTEHCTHYPIGGLWFKITI